MTEEQTEERGAPIGVEVLWRANADALVRITLDTVTVAITADATEPFGSAIVEAARMVVMGNALTAYLADKIGDRESAHVAVADFLSTLHGKETVVERRDA